MRGIGPEQPGDRARQNEGDRGQGDGTVEGAERHPVRLPLTPPCREPKGSASHGAARPRRRRPRIRRAPSSDRKSEEHTSELQSLMRISYAVFCLKKKKTTKPE